MKCILMNKETPVMLVEYDTKANQIKNIYEEYNLLYAPLSIINAKKDKAKSLVKETNYWFKGRGIPSWRKDLESMLEKLNVRGPEELLNKAYALSLSDQYWLKEEKSKITWDNINFFTNDFLYTAYLNISLDSSSHEKISNPNILMSPNNTTDGMLQKGWIIEDKKRVLVKGTYSTSLEEPFNEYLASQISKRLGFYYCDYTVSWEPNIHLVSKCSNFITEDEEIISAYDIFNSEKHPNNMNDYEFYLSILAKHHVPYAREHTAQMFLVDYLMLNTDRHLKNFGVIRNVKTLEWVRTTPIFDTGEAMECDKLTDEINFNYGTGKFFTNPKKDFEAILKTIINDIRDVDLRKLDGLVDDYYSLLKEYQQRLDISDRRIAKLTNGLKERIAILKDALIYIPKEK